MGLISDAKERWKTFYYESPCGKDSLKHGVAAAATSGLIAFLVRGTTKSLIWMIPAYIVASNSSLVYCHYQIGKANQKLVSQGEYVKSLPKLVRQRRQEDGENLKDNSNTSDET